MRNAQALRRIVKQESLRVRCAHCRTAHCVRDRRTLRPTAKSQCAQCGARFGIAVSSSVSHRRPERFSTDEQGRTGQLASSNPLESQLHREHPSFHGNARTLFGIQVVNIFFTLMTLGIYHFWAKAKVRRYMFGQTEFAGDRFMYHGTGKELYRGFMKAVLVFWLPYFVLGSLPEYVTLPPWAVTVCGLSTVIILWVFAPVAVVGARRYRCSRTSWRGIRFSFDGKVWAFTKLMLKGTALTALTAGTYYPYYQVRRQEFLVRHTRFGNRPFQFEGTGTDLASGFVLTQLLTFFAVMIPLFLAFNFNPLFLLLVPFTVAPPWIWFMAKKQRYFWDHTRFGRAQFRSTLTPRALLNVYVGNFLLLVATLGFAWPWTTIRNLHLHLDNLRLIGPFDPEHILQDLGIATTTGEGLANTIDGGFDLD